ncbi:hypothetical protein OTU49_009370 [Cherax quadricarinatus]|uniref:Proline-rich transmembrane protein 3/4 domain-containing protein n=1 Tax=Cherax quadricarinatus TaxID=27406 RepID=A0AAW0WKV0_CHEQU
MAGYCTHWILPAAALWVLCALSVLGAVVSAQSLSAAAGAYGDSATTTAQDASVVATVQDVIAKTTGQNVYTTTTGQDVFTMPTAQDVSMNTARDVSRMSTGQDVLPVATAHNPLTMTATITGDIILMFGSVNNASSAAAVHLTPTMVNISTLEDSLTAPLSAVTDGRWPEPQLALKLPPLPPDTLSDPGIDENDHLASSNTASDGDAELTEKDTIPDFPSGPSPYVAARTTLRKTGWNLFDTREESESFKASNTKTASRGRKYLDKIIPSFRDTETSKSEVSAVPRPPSPNRLLLSAVKNQVVRRSAAGDVLPSVPLHRHRHRHGNHHGNLHGNSRVPSRLKDQPGESLTGRQNHFRIQQELEDDIGEVFRDVAYRGSSSKSYPPVRQYKLMTILSNPGSSRIERTTVLSKNPHYDYMADGRRGILMPVQRNISAPDVPSSKSESRSSRLEPGSDAHSYSNSSSKTKNKDGTSVIERILELQEYDHELYDLYEGHYTDSFEGDGKSEIPRRGNFEDNQTSMRKFSASQGSGEPKNETQTKMERTKKSGIYKHASQLSWFDALLCSNRTLAWIVVNFTLGLLLLGLSLLAAFRLLTLKSCTHLLPRTHFVSIHLLVFIAAFLKALYLFHLAYGRKERLPLVLVLLLTNTGFPSFSSSFLILMIMMFLTADVHVYKPKLFTMHNISIFVIMKFSLCFVADIIVGCAHSKSVLVLSRVMLIAITVAMIVFYARKHQMVLQVSQMLKREFQGELKLLVVPSKDLSQERQMGIKHILRNRLNMWCRIMKLSATALAVLCLVHLFHIVFLISSNVPAWGWWTFHISGCLVESLLCLSICMAAALTQRYDEKVSFFYSFMVPSYLKRSHKEGETKERNGNVIYQRVSFSSGTESTQYTSCFPETGTTGCEPISRTPKAPKRRGVTVKRSATFSYGPPHQPATGDTYGPPIALSQVLRAGSASQIPMYRNASGSHVSIYGPNLVSRVPIYSPPSFASMLVHEDGFVRIKSQLDPLQGNSQLHHSQGTRHDPNIQEFNPQIHGCPLQQLNGLGRQESFYQSLSRRRRNSRSSDIHNNIDSPESDYTSSPGSRSGYQYSPSFPSSIAQGRTESDYQSLSRRRNIRDPNVQHLNNIEKQENNYHSLQRRKGRNSGHDLQLQHMNNLDRGENDYHSLTRRQVSHEDNNYPGGDCDYHHTAHVTRKSFREPRLPSLNLYDEQGLYRLPSQRGSPSMQHKISNFPASPSVSTVHNTFMSVSPGSSRREAHFPKPFVRIGSNVSLQTEDTYCPDYFARGNPVRRNHSSAGYFPSRNRAPHSPSLTDALRYGSLRLGMTRKRQPGYIFNTNANKLFDQNRDRYPKNSDGNGRARDFKDKTNVNEGTERGPLEDLDTTQATNTRASPSTHSQSPGTKSASSDQDWALELIKSSSILTDFYSLEEPEEEDRVPEEDKTSGSNKKPQEADKMQGKEEMPEKDDKTPERKQENEPVKKEDKMPVKEEKIPGKEDKMPGKEDKMPGKENTTPGKENTTPGKEHKTPDKENKMLAKEDKAQELRKASDDEN